MLWFILITGATCIALIIVTQDVQIFPLALVSFFQSKTRDPNTIPNGIEASFAETSDGKKIEVWKLESTVEPIGPSKVVILFHGNGNLVDTFVDLQYWFAQQGMTSYSFDYRGYGKSTGWPSENGLYLDSEAVWKKVLTETSVRDEEICVLGFSIGSGLAAKLAHEKKVGVLILLSAYSDLAAVVREHKVFAPLVRFLKYKFDTAKYVGKLENTHLIVMHGKKDPVIKFSHFSKVISAYQGSGSLHAIDEPEAAHNDLFDIAKPRLAVALKSLKTLC